MGGEEGRQADRFAAEFLAHQAFAAGRLVTLVEQQVERLQHAVEPDREVSVQQLLEKVGLGERGKSKFKTYSLGMKQRLGIAAALLPNPKLLMLDEPTNGLDPEGIQEVRALLRDLANDGTTVFVSSHLLSELEIISDYIVMLRKGEIVFAGPIGELMAQQQPTIIAKSLNHSDLARIVEISEKAGHHAVIRNDSVHILAEMDWAPVLNKAAFDAGITLAQLAPQLPNLEETFFEMTGDK